MLPEIVEVAKLHHMELNQRTIHHEEVLAKCPFCQEDSKPGKRRRYYLSLNSRDQVFKCWYCGESGGVLRFISLLEGVPEEEVKSRYRRRKIVHPAERLSRKQRMYLNITEPDWEQLRQSNFRYYMHLMDLLWKKWNEFLDGERRQAYFWLLLGIRFNKYSNYIAKIRIREKEIESPLLEDALDLFSRPARPAWTERVDDFIQRYSHPVSPEPNDTAGEVMEVKHEFESSCADRTVDEGP